MFSFDVDWRCRLKKPEICNHDRRRRDQQKQETAISSLDWLVLGSILILPLLTSKEILRGHSNDFQVLSYWFLNWQFRIQLSSTDFLE